MNEEQMMRRKLSAIQFSLWELHLFLDTHPNNCDAQKKSEDYKIKYEQLLKEFERDFGPLNQNLEDTSLWAWVSEPWPWEVEGNK